MRAYIRKDLLAFEGEVETIIQRVRTLEREIEFVTNRIPELEGLLQAGEKQAEDKIRQLRRDLEDTRINYNLASDIRDRRVKAMENEITRVEAEQRETATNLLKQIEELKESLPKQRKELETLRQKLSQFVEIEVSGPTIWAKG